MADNKKNTEEITISLDSLGVPIAIVIAGLFIAGGIFLSSRNTASNLDSNQDTNVAGEDTTDDTTTPDTTETSTTIDDDPYVGNIETAKVAIVEFSDFQCSYCGRHTSETYPEIYKNYVETGEVIYVFRDYQMFGELSETTAKIGECIADIDAAKYSDFHENAYMLGSVDEVYEEVVALGLSKSEVESCVANYDSAELENDMSDGAAAGVEGTPAFVVGKLDSDGNVVGGFIAGAYPYETFETMIESYLE